MFSDKKSVHQITVVILSILELMGSYSMGVLSGWVAKPTLIVVIDA
jgi:hypothetical protein